MAAAGGEQAAKWLEGTLPQMEEALSALVNVNSFTDNPEGGRKVGRLLQELFAIPGLEGEVIPSQRYADHLVFRSASPHGKPLALVGHLDTVFPPGKFEGYRVDGELRRGPGVLDMKGGLVVIAFAIKALQATVGLSEIAPLRLVIVSDEEVGSPEGAGILREAARGAGASLVFESGRDKDAIITRRKGTGAITAVAHGRAAHAGNGHKEGANAIWAMARFVDRVQQLTDYEQGITVNVGKIGGGQGKNTVPDHVEALADMRFCTQADAEALIARVQAAAEQAGASLANTRVEVDAKVLRPPLERTEGNVALMEAYAAAAKVCGLGFGEAGLIGGGSDASTTSAIGIPSIDGLGPRGKGFHTVEEMIEVNTLIPKAQALARYLAAARY